MSGKIRTYGNLTFFSSKFVKLEAILQATSLNLNDKRYDGR